MPGQRYELRYLPLFYDDLQNAAIYIAGKLKNPEAAKRLVDAVENAILERLSAAESYEQYHSFKDRIYPYYRIYVGKYIVYYVVIDHRIMEVRRLLYSGRNQREFI